MNLSAQLARHIHDVHFGGNWTSVNLRDTLKDVTWQQSVTNVHKGNTIATLVYHTNYYIAAVTKVLLGGPLEAKDAYSFDLPPIRSDEDWQHLLQKTWSDAEAFAGLVAALPESTLWEPFTDEKYGNYYRNIQGITEHLHYHLGQIVIIKKILNTEYREQAY